MHGGEPGLECRKNCVHFGRMNTSHQQVGFVTRSSDYLQAAKNLIASQEAGILTLRTEDRIDVLIGHAFELILRACLLSLGEGHKNPGSFKHDILKLYSYLCDQADSIRKMPDHINEKWRAELSRLRMQTWEEFPNYACAMEKLCHPNQDQIDAVEFDVSEDIKWYNDQMTKAGNQFRYFSGRLQILPQVVYGNKNLHRPRQSLIWATEYVSERLNQ